MNEDVLLSSYLLDTEIDHFCMRTQLEKVEDLENDIEVALAKFDKKHNQQVLHSVSYY